MYDSVRDFWVDVTRMRNSKSHTPMMVEAPFYISKIFARKYRQLYTRVSNDGAEMRSLLVALDNRTPADNMYLKSALKKA
jgi:hypothetical protein